MIRLLLVEDEPLMRQAIVSLLPWQDHGMIIAQQACDGREALSYLAEDAFDIVLSDIRMPILDGIELLREAAAHLPQTAFVMLSAYDDFNLVKSAFKLGASDYIIKSEITEEQVISVLTRVYQDLSRRRQERAAHEKQVRLAQLFAENLPMLRQRRLQVLLDNPAAESWPTPSECEIYKLRLEGERIAVMALTLTGNQRNQLDAAGQRLFQETASGIIEQILAEEHCGNLIVQSVGHYMVLYSFAQTGDSAILDRLAHLFQTMRTRLQKQMDVRLAGGISDLVSDLTAVPRLCQQAAAAVRQSFIKGHEQLIRYSAAEEPDAFMQAGYVDRSAALKALLAALDPEAILEELPSFQIHVLYLTPEEEAKVRRIFARYQALIEEAAAAWMIDQELLPAMTAYHEAAADQASLGRLNEWLTWALHDFAAAIGQSNTIVNKARQIIQKQYDRHLTLNDVAEAVGVSSSYLSRLFNKTVGCSFIDYLSRLRMDTALRYFRETNLKIYEVAEKVGYSNPEHFSRVFKKYFKNSPKDLFS